MAHSLFRQLVVAVAIGNLDMHAKNISVLHLPDGACRLAPAYDMVPQSHLPTDGELALAVNDKYGHADVTATDLVAEGERWQISGASSIVDQVLSRLAAAVRGEVPLAGLTPGWQRRSGLSSTACGEETLWAVSPAGVTTSVTSSAWRFPKISGNSIPAY